MEPTGKPTGTPPLPPTASPPMHAVDLPRCEAVLLRAAADGRAALLEHEGLELLAALGLHAPRFAYVPLDTPVEAALEAVGGERVVLKVVSPRIAHKSDVGGVRRVVGTKAAVVGALHEMQAAIPARLGVASAAAADIRGWLVVEEVPYEPAPGHELLVGVRHTDAFGPVLVLGMGGVHSEMWARSLHPARAVAMRAAGATPESLRRMLDDAFVGDWLLGRTRTGEKLVDADAVVDVLARFGELALACSPSRPAGRVHLVELEVNPLVVAGGVLRPVDVLLRFAPAAASAALPLPRPQAGIGRLLRPESAALAGVSERGANPGRLILRNLLRDGFARERIYVVKPGGGGTIEDCRVVDGVAALPEPVDLFVIATPAPLVPDLVEEIERRHAAAGVLLIPGGIGEKEGTGSVEARIAATIRAAREAGGGAVYAGSNSLGLVSGPGRCDTMFIPAYKLPPSASPDGNAAIVSQSGAFVIARLSKQHHLRPRYALSIGNQTDLTFSDYLRWLRDDPGVEVVALYVEGFRPLDGLQTAHEVAALVASGREVIVYKAGRTAAGRSSTAGHTASIAGDYAVAAALLREAGAWVAETFEEFEDALKLCALLHRRPPRGRRVGAMSNAGFESVGLADNIEAAPRPLVLPPFGAATAAAIRAAFARARIADIVDVHNPLDVTPISDDACFAEHVAAILADPDVDGAVVSIVPLTAALGTLEPQPGVHREDVAAETSVARRLTALAAASDKPFVVTVDSGRLYDRLCDLLEAGGVPVFREADHAMRLFARWVDLRLGRGPSAPAAA